VKAGGQRDIDGIDFWVVEEVLIRAINLGAGWKVVGFGKSGGFIQGAASDSREFSVGC
jgi:hypothetical protein